jgi:hypothetical protein
MVRLSVLAGAAQRHDRIQIDWIPLSIGAVRPTQGKTLAVMQVSGGSQSFNAVNQLRILRRWMRMITIPNYSPRKIEARVFLPHKFSLKRLEFGQFG